MDSDNTFYIEYYTKSNGIKPAQEFLQELKSKRDLYGLAYAGIDKLKNGSNHGMPLTRKIGKELFELRPNRIRIMFCFSKAKSSTIVLLCGNIKVSGKTKEKDLDFAKKCLGDYRLHEQTKKAGSKIYEK